MAFFFLYSSLLFFGEANQDIVYKCAKTSNEGEATLEHMKLCYVEGCSCGKDGWPGTAFILSTEAKRTF